MRSKRAIIFIALALASCGKPGSRIVIPPTKYDHAPTVRFLDVRLPYWKIDAYCRTHADFVTAAGDRIEGCAIAGRVPVRVVPAANSGVDAGTIAAIIRHENGHLNGWPADHPGGRYL